MLSTATPTRLDMVLREAKALWILAWPIAVGQIANTGTSFVDTVMAGHVSAEDLAAVALGSSIWFTLVITLIGLLLSVAPVIAQLYGAKRLSEIPNIVQQGLWLL